MNADFDFNIEDGRILPEDFDELEYPLFIRKNQFKDEEYNDEDPADTFDIFPYISKSESKYFPGSWRPF